MDYPIILHILSYNDEHLCMLISKGLQVYNNRAKKSKLPVSLLLKAICTMCSRTSSSAVGLKSLDRG